MKNIISYIGAAVIMAFAGCKNPPTVAEMEKLGTASGYTVAYVLNNQVKVDDETRNTVIDVMNEVERYIPETNMTYTATWTPIAQTFVDKAVSDGKITQQTADRVMKDFGYIVGLLDSYVEKKEIAGQKDLVNAFVHSFFRSFLTHFKPVNMMAAGSEIPEQDQLTLTILNDLIK